ncbi:MAG: PEGA domain-containing protein [Kofleriaceae bacterium]|nr:PEGA domain-containing protein [Kofleriaceae bacterium]
MASTSNDTDIDIEIDDFSSDGMSDAQTNPLPRHATSGSKASLWLAAFAVLVIGGAIVGGYLLAVRQGNSGLALVDANTVAAIQPVATPKERADIPLSEDEEAIAPDPPAAEVDSETARNTGIDVLVDPVGAKVSLDGHYLGQAPLRVRNLLPGRHSVVIESVDGSREEIRSIDLKSGEALMISVVLANTETATVDSDRFRRPSKVRSRNRVPTAVATSAGTEAEPKPVVGKVSLGTLMLGSKPPCEIAINGKATGTSTPQRAIQLPEGLHRVVLTNKKQGIRKSFKVRIKAGRTTRAIQDLRPKL